MRLVTLLSILLLYILTGCNKSEENKEFAATYTGLFVRTNDAPSYCPMVANVTLNFTKNSFNGTSNARNYPAICSGTFTISQSKIEVKNSCYFTADFDGTFIFDGTYEYEQSGNKLRIWRTYANGFKDGYDLTRLE
jgi:hypothetical protein